MVRHTIFVFHSAGFGQLVRNSAISRAWKATLSCSAYTLCRSSAGIGEASPPR